MENPELFLAFLVITFALEFLLWYFMPAWYYRIGLPIYTRSQVMPSVRSRAPSDLDLEQVHPSGAWGSFIFKQFEDGMIGVRETSKGASLFMSYTPVMHATLRMEAKTRTATITGNLNLYMLGFFGMLAYSLVKESHAPMFMVIAFTLVFGMLYTIQAVRYLGVLDSVKKAWTA